MEEHASFTSLTIVSAIAFVIPILLQQLKLKFLPVVVAEIIVGLLVGKSGFGLISEDSWLELLSMFGLIYLMFLSGLEIEFGQIRSKGTRKRIGPNPLVAASAACVGIGVVSYGLAQALLLMGFVSEPYLPMIMIATVSLGVVVPVLKEQKLIETPFGQTILLVSVIADFVTMIMLAVYISLRSQSVSSLVLLLVFFALVVTVYIFIKRSAKGKFAELVRRGTSQIGTRGVFALLLLFVVLSENMGVENILGAFLAGVILSLLSPDKSFVHQLESFGYGFLIPIFFIMVGVKLDVWALLSDWQIVLFIPVFLAAVYISKLVPSLLLGYWFGWKKALGAGILLSSTLSLVIAAATVAQELGIIDASMQGALVLVAILTCLISPVYFNRLVPKADKPPSRIAIVGANHVTLPVSQDLMKDGCLVDIFSSSVDSGPDDGRFPLRQVDRLDIETLEEAGAFEADVLVCGSMDETLNLEIARHARRLGIERLIVRLEDPDLAAHAQEEGYTVFSTLYSSRILLKGLIDHPSALRLITQHDDSIQEIEVRNPAYNRKLLRMIPFVGNALVLRVYRGESFIIPHGSTEINLGDRLLVSGSGDHLRQMKEEFE